jgi:hypothetical protein
MSEITPQHSHNAQSLSEQMAALTDRVDSDMAAVFEQLDEQSKMILSLKAQMQNLDDRRGWVDEIALILNWVERNRTNIFSAVAIAGLVALAFNVSLEQRDKAFERLTTPEAIASMLLAGTGATVALTKK